VTIQLHWVESNRTISSANRNKNTMRNIDHLDLSNKHYKLLLPKLCRACLAICNLNQVIDVLTSIDYRYQYRKLCTCICMFKTSSQQNIHILVLCITHVFTTILTNDTINVNCILTSLGKISVLYGIVTG
jgi:hypothetical protein